MSTHFGCACIALSHIIAIYKTFLFPLQLISYAHCPFIFEPLQGFRPKDTCSEFLFVHESNPNGSKREYMHQDNLAHTKIVIQHIRSCRNIYLIYTKESKNEMVVPDRPMKRFRLWFYALDRSYQLIHYLINRKMFSY